MEITLEDVKDYLRILDNSEDVLLTQLIDSAVEFIAGETGLESSIVRTQSDLIIAIQIYVSDFYWNRDYQTSTKYNNRLVDRIIENNRTNFVK